MAVGIQSVTFDCKDYWPLLEFWSALTGFGEDPDDPNRPGDPVGGLRSPDGSLSLLFIPVPEPKSVKNRVHLDLRPTDRTRDEQVAVALELGATLVADHREPDGSGWVTLADPEGNEFCICRSDAERSSSVG